MIMVMSTSEHFGNLEDVANSNPLWRITCDKIEEFLPNLLKGFCFNTDVIELGLLPPHIQPPTKEIASEETQVDPQGEQAQTSESSLPLP
jgi:hypothetical protein